MAIVSMLTVGGNGLAFFDNGSSSSDSFSPLLSSFNGFVEAAARFERCGVLLLFALFFVGAFRFGDSCLVFKSKESFFISISIGNAMHFHDYKPRFDHFLVPTLLHHPLRTIRTPPILLVYDLGFVHFDHVSVLVASDFSVHR